MLRQAQHFLEHEKQYKKQLSINLSDITRKQTH